MKEVTLRLLALCAICAATERMRLGRAIGHIGSLCVIEAIVELIVRAIGSLV